MEKKQGTSSQTTAGALKKKEERERRDSFFLLLFSEMLKITYKHEVTSFGFCLSAVEVTQGKKGWKKKEKKQHLSPTFLSTLSRFRPLPPRDSLASGR